MYLKLIFLGLSEVAALFFILRLWRRSPRRPLPYRIFWSVLLVVPVVGVLFYGLASNDPPEKPGWGGENNQGWGDDTTNYHP